MGKLLALFTGNPISMLYVAGAIAGVAGLAGASGAWTIQGYRLDAVKADYERFKGITKAQGEAAAKEAARVNLVNSTALEAANHEYAKVKTDLAGTYAAYRKLLDSSRKRPLPQAAPVTGATDRTCYRSGDITKSVDDLEKSVFGGFDRLDAAVPSVLEQGDTARVRLVGSMKWAESITKP